MLDINFIRNNQELIREGMRKKRMSMDLDELLACDDELRKLRNDVEKLRSDRNRISKDIPKLQGEKKDEAVAEVKAIREALNDKEPKLRDVEVRFEQLMLLVPNPPLPDVPEGESEEDNVEVRKFGKRLNLISRPKTTWNWPKVWVFSICQERSNSRALACIV
jgi:seryl-tRNA synthetase